MNDDDPLAPRRAIDLSAVRTHLADLSAFPAVCGSIDKALTAQSCLADLREAVDCRSALADLLASPRGRGTRRRETTETALMTMSVMLYARATSTNGQKGERGSIQINASLTPEQLEDHDALVVVRNRALAHVYTNQEIGGEVRHEGVIFLVEEGTGWLPGVANKRITFDPKLFARLCRQLPIALDIIEAKSKKRIDQAVVAIMAAKADPVFQRAVDAAAKDLAEVFGSEEAARNAIKSLNGGPQAFRG